MNHSFEADRCGGVGRKRAAQRPSFSLLFSPYCERHPSLALVERERLALLQLDALLVQTLHGVHLARVGFPASVDFSESSASDDPVNGEVVHAEGDVQFQIFPLAKTGKFVALDELLELDVIKRFFPSSLTRRQ